MHKFIYQKLDVPGGGDVVPDRPDRRNEYARNRAEILAGSAQSRMLKLGNVLGSNLESELGIKVDVDDLVAKYEAVPKAERIPVESIAEHLNQLFHAAKGCPKFAQHIAAENSHLVDNLLVQLINGDKEAAAETLNELVKLFVVATEFQTIEDNLKTQREGIKVYERKHNAEVRRTKKMIEDGSNDSVAMTLQGERQAKAYFALIGSLKSLVDIQETFIGKGEDSYLRDYLMVDLSGGPSTYKTIALVENEGKLKVVKIESDVPNSKAEYENLLSNAKNDIRFKRRNLYLLTKAQEFKADFDATQQMMTEGLYNEAHSELDKAKTIDKNDRYAKEASDFADRVVMRFDSIQKMQPNDIKKTIDAAGVFYKDMDEVIRLIDRGSSNHGPKTSGGLDVSINFGAIKKEAPSTSQVLKNMCEAYRKQADNLARDCLQMDPKILEFQKDFSSFWSNAEGVMITAQNIAKDLENGGDLPTETMMNSIRKDIDHFVRSDKYMSGFSSSMAMHMMELRRSANHLPSVKAQLKSYEDIQKNLEAFNSSMTFLYSNPGSREGWLGIGKNVLSFGAAIAAAVAAGAIFAGTGGTGSAVSAFILVQTAGVLGYAGAEYALGNKAAMEPKNLAYSWGMAMLMGGAGALLAKPLGSIIGSRVAVANQKLMQSRFAPLRALGKSGLEKRAGGILSPKTVLGKGGLLSQFLHEFGEEAFQEGVEGLGAAVAGDNPPLSFVLNVLACSPAHARSYADNGSFSINQDITVDLSPTNMQVRYSNKRSMLNYLQSINAPASMINQFKRTGRVISNEGGIKVHIRNTPKPQGVRRLLTQRGNKNIARRAGLKWVSKDTYTYKGSKAELIRMFKMEYFVEETSSGDLILTDTQGNKITVRATGIDGSIDPARAQTKDSVTNLAKSIKDHGLRQASLDVVADIWSGTKAGLIRGVQKLNKIYDKLKESGAGRFLKTLKDELDKRSTSINDITTVFTLLGIAGIAAGSGLYAYLTNRSFIEDVRSDLSLGDKVRVDVGGGRTENWTIAKLDVGGKVMVTRDGQRPMFVKIRELTKLNPHLLDDRRHEGNFNKRLEPGKSNKFTINEPVILVLSPDLPSYMRTYSLSVSDTGEIEVEYYNKTYGRNMKHTVPVGEPAVFGRNDFDSSNERLSVRHLRIINLGGGKFEIQDLNSTNGTRVDSGRRVDEGPRRDVDLQKPPERRHEGYFNKDLERGRTYRYSIKEAVTLILGSSKEVKSSLRAMPDGTLVITYNDKSHVMGVGADLYFGRADFDRSNRYISANHFRIKNMGNGQFELEDLSSNGTRVDSNYVDRGSRVDVGSRVDGPFRISQSLGELFAWLNSQGPTYNGVSTEQIKANIEAYIRGNGSISPDGIPRAGGVRQRAVDIMTEYQREAIQANLQRNKVPHDVTLNNAPRVENADYRESEFAISRWLGAESADTAHGEIVDHVLADNFRRSGPQKLEMKFRNGSTVNLLFPRSYGHEIARIQQHIIIAEQWIQTQFGQYGVKPRENLTIVFMEDVRGHHKCIRGHAGSDSIIMRANSIGTQDFYETYFHERTHAVLGAHNLRAHNGGAVEGIANYMGDAGARHLGFRDPQMMKYSGSKGRVAKEILANVKRGMSYFEALTKYFERKHDETNYSLNYEYGQAFTAAFIDHFHGDIGKFLRVYSVLGQRKYDRSGYPVNRMYADAMIEAGLSQQEVISIMHETAGRLMLRAHKGRDLIDMLVSQSPNELHAILKGQDLKTILGLNNPTLTELKAHVEDAKRYALRSRGRRDSISYFNQFLDGMLAANHEVRGMGLNTQMRDH